MHKCDQGQMAQFFRASSIFVFVVLVIVVAFTSGCSDGLLQNGDQSESENQNQITSTSSPLWSPPTCPYGNTPTPDQINNICYKKTEFKIDTPRRNNNEILCGFDECKGQADPWTISGAKTGNYNCFAWSDDFRTDVFISDFDNLCKPDPSNPSCAKCKDGQLDLEDADCYYMSKGWKIANTFHKECNQRKMCIAGIKEKVIPNSGPAYTKTTPLHGMIEECDPSGSWGGWGSKMGSSYRVHHSMFDALGSAYGGLVRCYNQYQKGANTDACAPNYEPWNDSENRPPECFCNKNYKLRNLNPWVCGEVDKAPPFKGSMIPGQACTAKCIGTSGKNSPCVMVISCPCIHPFCISDILRTYKMPPYKLPKLMVGTKAANHGYNKKDKFGSSVVVIEDVSGDRIEDLAIGIPGADEKSGHVLIMDSLTSEVHRVLYGEMPNSQFGKTLAFNNGVLAVGAPGFGENGAVFMFDMEGNHLNTLISHDPDIRGFGAKMVTGPEFEGMASFLVGAPKSSPNGTNEAGSAFWVLSNGETLAQINGWQENAALGFSMAAAENGWLVSAPNAKVQRNASAGRVWFIPWHENMPAWSLSGNAENQMLGYSLAGGKNLGWGEEGIQFVIGSPGAEMVTVVNDRGEEMGWIPSAHEFMEMSFGGMVSTPGDIDNDGHEDIVVGAVDLTVPLSFIYSNPDLGAGEELSREEHVSGPVFGPSGQVSVDHEGEFLVSVHNR